MMRSMKTNRTDIVTKKIFDRNELIRISINKNGVTRIDDDYNLGGRGIYVHPKSIEKALKSKILLKKINKFGGNWENIIDLLKKKIK